MVLIYNQILFSLSLSLSLFSLSLSLFSFFLSFFLSSFFSIYQAVIQALNDQKWTDFQLSGCRGEVKCSAVTRHMMAETHTMREAVSELFVTFDLDV